MKKMSIRKLSGGYYAVGLAKNLRTVRAADKRDALRKVKVDLQADGDIGPFDAACAASGGYGKARM